MNDFREEHKNNIDSFNLSYFSPSMNDIVRFFNTVMNIIITHAEKQNRININSFGSKVEENKDTLKISNFPDECPHCKTEESLKIDNAPWEYDGEFLDVSAICRNCGKRSKTVYHIEFEQTEGREE